MASVLIGAVRIVTGQTSRRAAILLYVRLPRILLAFSVGAGLAVCGAVMQTLFRNPLADPARSGFPRAAPWGRSV